VQIWQYDIRDDISLLYNQYHPGVQHVYTTSVTQLTDCNTNRSLSSTSFFLSFKVNPSDDAYYGCSM